jgi:CHASE1-domain containing sensor protein
VKVVFYPTQDRSDPRQALGEVLIDEIPANSTKEAVLRYKLTDPGRAYRFSFEPFLKGSLQRIPHSE